MSEEDDVRSIPSLKAIRRLLPFAGPNRSYLFLAFILLALMALVQVLLPQILRLAIDGPLGEQQYLNQSERAIALEGLAELFLGFLALAFIANYLSTWLLQKFGQTLVFNLRHQLFAKHHRLPISYFDKQAVGRTVTRIINDSNSLSELFTSVLASGLRDIVLLAGILVVLLATDPVLSAILAFFCPALVALVVWFRKRSAPLYQEQRTLVAKINGYFSEILEGLATVKCFQGDGYQTNRFASMNQECLSNEMKLLRLLSRFRPGFAVARIAASASLLTIGGWFILEDSTSVGVLISSLLYISLLFSPLEELAERYNILIRSTVACERVLSILDLDDEPTQNKISEPGQDAIRFEHVSFHYDPDKPVLRDVSFEVKPGQCIALVGPTGSGKSTVVSLLLGFYRLDPSTGHTGQIKVGEVNLSDLDLAAWRRQLAFVSQDLFLFKGTLAHNIGLFGVKSPERIELAIEQAACRDFVEKLPEKSATIVGEKGHNLSTGQKQLISFARALAYDPKLLILDEASANIDSETEVTIEKALDSLLPGRQSIIIAHRLSTVRRANLILVLENGRISERGTHEQLMSLNGVYANMVHNSESQP